MSLLDVGCGSGILSVAGLLLGAEKAVGVDIDALAVKTAGENAQTNGVEEKFQGICGNLTDQVAGKYELVVANIVADIIILLTKDITRYLNPDSIYLMSGIIDTRVQEVRDAWSLGLRSLRSVRKRLVRVSGKTKELTRCVRSYFC